MGSFGASAPRTEIEQRARWSPEQQQLFGSMFGQVNQQLGKAAPTSPDMYVPRTGEDQSYFDWMQNLAQSRAASGQPLYDVGPEWAENYYEQAIKPMYMKEWEDVARPGIHRAYAGPGFYSSARMEQEAEGSQDLAMELAAKKAGLVYGEEKERRTALDRAFGQQLQAGEAMGQAGQYSRVIEQEKVMSDLQKFLMGEEVEVGRDANNQPIYSQQPLNSAAMQQAMQLLGLDPYVWATESKGADLGYATFPKFMGGFGQGLGQAIGSKSDRRLKKDIVYI